MEQAERSPDFRKLEEKVQKQWEEGRVFEKVTEAREGAEDYYFLDGPPYASGAIHLGTAWNKVLKDSILRYLTMKGLNVRRQAGWDCHGLPIEVQVEKEMGIKNKKEIDDDVEDFINRCKEFALRHIDIMTKQFRRLGVWMDWEDPYMTLKDEYIEAAWWTIKNAHEKGLLTRDLRVVTWCPRCETALADAEIEYKDRSDPSIYVKFPLVDREDEYILIWTTTPWTLIANLAVMVNPDFKYVRTKTSEGILILAEELADHVLREKLGLEYEILQTVDGSDLEGLRYRNPLSDVIDVKAPENAYMVILSADYVSLGEGTGCVHCAPGHGPEDFEVGAAYGIGPVCPVDEEGKFTPEAGKYEGLVTKKDDPVITADLKEKGYLPLEEKVSHRYGHCWRCKTPIIYRATEQWFIKVTELKERMLEEIATVDWIPDWAGSARFKDWIEHAKDWTISRQRYWGIPLPVWVCDKCGEMEVIGLRKEIEGRGIELPELHKPHVDNVKLECSCGGEMGRVPDVLDVWFDSGVGAWASLGYPSRTDEFDRWYPTEFITEGHDQTRGWFYSLLGCGLLSFDRVPYKRVLMHGFTLDEKGEKMSKSLGNVVAPEEVVERYGADVLRFYVLWACKPWEDLKFNWQEVEVVSRMFNILWNSYVFATTYMTLDGFTPEKAKGLEEHYRTEDRWILSRLNSAIKEVTEGFETLHIYRAPRALHEFILEDLSRWYITLIRPRTWIEKDDPTKLSAYAVLHEVQTKLSIILSPIAPHLTEEMYRNLSGARESVHLEDWPAVDEAAVDTTLEEQMRVVRKYTEAEAAAREKAQVKRRWPVKRTIAVPTDEEVKTALEALKDVIMGATNTLSFEVKEPGWKLEDTVTTAVPNPGTIGPEFKGKAQAVIEHLKAADGRKVREAVEAGGYRIEVDGEALTVTEKHVTFREETSERYSTAGFDFGTVIIDLETDDEIMALRYAKEVVRRIQEMRKEQDLAIEADIEVAIGVRDEIGVLLETQKGYIARETRAREIAISGALPTGDRGYRKTWKVSGEKIDISISSP
jgi:isoleucyl-tRNA synthetase